MKVELLKTKALYGTYLELCDLDIDVRLVCSYYFSAQNARLRFWACMVAEQNNEIRNFMLS